MSDLEIMAFLIDFLVTALAYCFAPTFAKYMLGKKYTDKQARTFAIINSTVIFIGFSIFQLAISNGMKMANTLPPFLYGGIVYYLLKPHSNNPHSESKQHPENILDDSSKKIINELMKKSNLPQNICTDVFIILTQFSNSNRELAYKSIDSLLIPDLITNNHVGDVGIAFGMMVDKKALSREESIDFSQQVIMKMVNNGESNGTN